MNESMDLNNIKKLVFSGGGLAGLITIGALHRFEQEIKKPVNEQIDTYVGSSIGAIISVLLSIGYTPKELFKEMKKQKMLEIEVSIDNLIDMYGLDPGMQILDWIGDIIEKKQITREITLEELYAKTQKRVVLITTCVDDQKSLALDYILFPKLKLLHAIRMSIGIPFIFTAVLWQNKRYVDGGILNNYPIDLFDANDTTVLGFMLFTKPCELPTNQENPSHGLDFKDYTLKLFGCLTQKMAALYYENRKHQTVLLRNSETLTFQFNISNSHKKKLFSIGIDQMNLYLQHRQHYKSSISTSPSSSSNTTVSSGVLAETATSSGISL